MIAKLDEECLRPGDPTAETLLAKFNGHFGSHAHYLSRETSRSDKTLGVKDFRLKHYAGDVRGRLGPIAGPVRRALTTEPCGWGRVWALPGGRTQVQYTADAFIDKNKDLLFRDLMAAMNTSELLIAKYTAARPGAQPSPAFVPTSCGVLALRVWTEPVPGLSSRRSRATT